MYTQETCVCVCVCLCASYISEYRPTSDYMHEYIISIVIDNGRILGASGFKPLKESIPIIKSKKCKKYDKNQLNPQIPNQNLFLPMTLVICQVYFTSKC